MENSIGISVEIPHSKSFAAFLGNFTELCLSSFCQKVSFNLGDSAAKWVKLKNKWKRIDIAIEKCVHETFHAEFCVLSKSVLGVFVE